MKTVLIVDDTKDYAENLRIILSHAGYNVVVALGGLEGLAQAISIKPDLILMDLLMPQQDGVQTTIKIREQGSLKNVPIIFLTAVTAADNAITSVDSKDFLTVSKMADQEILLNKIQKYLDKPPKGS